MKAVVVKGPGDVCVMEVPEPIGAPGDVLLKVRYVGLCGTDLNTFRGKNPLVEYPRVLGHEVSATVIENRPQLRQDLPLRTNVTLLPYTSCGRCSSCAVGRFNACMSNQTLGVQRDGAMTQRFFYPVEKIYTGHLAEKELCWVEPLSVGFHAAARGDVRSGDTVAVFGCGGVGLGAVSGAAFLGANVIAVDLDDDKLEIARLAGAKELINAGRVDLHRQLLALTNGTGPGCVIEAIGTPETFRAAVEEVAFAGRVIYIGYAKEPVAYETRLFVQKELDIKGSRNATPDDFHRVIQMLEHKKFPVGSATSSIISIEQVPSVLRQWSNNPAAFTKILVEID